MAADDRPPPSTPFGVLIGVFAAFWVAFTLPWLTGHVTIPWDAKAQAYPQLVFLANALRGGESPFWTPYVFSGHPQIADPQAFIFSPYALLTLFGPAPSFALVDAVTFAILGAGGVAVLMVFRDRGWHWAGALVAALVFCFGASAAWRVQHIGQILSLAAAAVTYLCLDRALRRRSIAWGAAAGFSGAVMLLGRDQVALIAAYLLAGVVIVHWGTHVRSLRSFATTLPPLFAGTVVGLALIAMPIAMSVAFGAQSNRPSIDFAGAGAGSLHPVHLITLFVPDLYGSSGPMEEVWGPPSFAWQGTGLFLAQNMYVLYIGAVPILAILWFGIVRGLAFERDIRAVTAATAIVLLYALGWYTPLFRVAYDFLPGVALFRRPADVTFLFGALMAVLAGYLVHRVVTATVPAARPWQRTLEIGIVFAAAAAALGLALWFERALTKAFVPLVTGAVSLGIGAMVLAFARPQGGVRPRLVGALLVVAVAADLTWNNGPTPSTAMPPDYHDVLRPDSQNATLSELRRRVEAGRDETRRDRVELLGLGFLWPNASLVHGLEHTLGYNPLRIGIYAAATGAIDTVGNPEQRQFPPSFPSYRSELANMLGLRWIVSPAPLETIDRRLPPRALTLVGRPGGHYLYENPEALPRVVLATNARAADFAALIAHGGWPEVDYTRTVLLEGVDRPPQTAAAGRARLVSYRNAEVVIEATAPPGGGWVVLFDPWHPWWTADVDGVPATLLRANAIFRAVRVDEGQSRVRFLFRPFAGLISGLSRN